MNETDYDSPWKRDRARPVVKGLYRKGFEREDILELFRFIDWLMVLPEALESRFETILQHFEQEEKMPYITHIERKGIQQGEARVLKRLLRRRFGELPPAIEQRLNEAEPSELENWAERVLSADTLGDVFTLT